MLKSMKELATDLKVSKQTIWRKVTIDYKEEMKDFITKEKGIIMINEKGQEFITNKINNTSDVTSNVTNNEIITLLKQNVTILQQQLKLKDKQIEELNKRLEEITKTLDQEQQLNAVNQKQILLLEENTSKKHWWNRKK